jgi:hypothetical protein
MEQQPEETTPDMPMEHVKVEAYGTVVNPPEPEEESEEGPS